MKSITRESGFTLIEIMIVVAIIGIIIAIASPAWIRARETTRSRSCQENLSKIDGAKEIYALEHGLPNGAEPEWDDLVGKDLYLPYKPLCPGDLQEYDLNAIGMACVCNYELPSWIDEKFDHNLDPED